MSRFTIARLALARFFVYVAILAVPIDETDCLSAGFAFADRIKLRAGADKGDPEHAA